MSAQPAMFSPGRVLVADGIVYLRELEESDDEVVRIVGESDDPVAAVGQCLKVGARALRAAHVTVDVDVIERSFSAPRRLLKKWARGARDFGVIRSDSENAGQERSGSRAVGRGGVVSGAGARWQCRGIPG